MWQKPQESIQLFFSQTGSCRPESGYVKLVLETDGQDDTSFQRTIVMGRSFDTYTSQYAINERTVSWAAYEEKLKTFGILVKARNFLVFQACLAFESVSKATKSFLKKDYVLKDKSTWLFE